VNARLQSLEELDAARAEYGEGARLLLSESGDQVAQLGSVADYLDVEGRHERAVEACLGDLLQHVIVESGEQAAAGLAFARARNAGRVGFLIAGQPAGIERPLSPHPDLTPLADVVRISGPAAGVIGEAIADAWIASSYDAAQAASASTHAPVATLDGEVFRGPHLVQGGARAEARGILTTKREIKELRERADLERAEADRLRDLIASLDVTIASVESAITAVQGELHRQEKATVGFELQVSGARETVERITRKQEQIATERRTAQEQLRAQEARQDEARESIARIEAEQRTADDLLNSAQRRLFAAREAMQAQAQRTSEAKASHAALVERAGALAAEVSRLEESARELETRVTTRQQDLERAHGRQSTLRTNIEAAETRLDAGVRAFDELRERVRTADETSQALRSGFDEQETRIREARRALDGVRAEAGQLEIARATAESDLSHLATSCVDSVQATLDEVAAEVAALERDGLLASPRPVDDAPDPAESEDEAGAPPAQIAEDANAAAGRTMTPDEMVLDLRAKLERMGGVNMMAIDQFDDLESRHAFLTTQRKDLVDSIAATGEAIRKIDKTTKERFREAFAVINANFERTFTTLFGGGSAGLTLLDEADQLESGIDIIAQPPGKRLQSVQLLSGGEKALTAMALMFAIFKYRPSPFCLLDEIDAPLDDANIGRFVEMLQGMQEHTQFILITHNRKTMEIANRLYGVTMEEPGVSKLISVQLN
jgi:chromosome segregation protein